MYHAVFSTKRRFPFIDPELRAKLYPYLAGIVRDRGGWLLALGGMPDHVHLLIRLTPDLPVADVVRHAKGGSSRWIHEQTDLSPDFAWQLGYAVFSVSASNEGLVGAYIRNQEKHHRRASLDEELLVLARTHAARPPRR